MGIFVIDFGLVCYYVEGREEGDDGFFCKVDLSIKMFDMFVVIVVRLLVIFFWVMFIVWVCVFEYVELRVVRSFILFFVFYVVDGGYFDNFGIVVVFEWFINVFYEGVWKFVFVEIWLFVESEVSLLFEDCGWVFVMIGLL